MMSHEKHFWDVLNDIFRLQILCVLLVTTCSGPVSFHNSLVIEFCLVLNYNLLI